MLVCFFFFNDTATTEIYTLSLHDALPISPSARRSWHRRWCSCRKPRSSAACATRSEEHTSELQSHLNIVCRLLLEKKNINHMTYLTTSTSTPHNNYLLYTSSLPLRTPPPH